MLFDTKGIYMIPDNNEYDFAVDIIDGKTSNGLNANNMNGVIKLYDLEEALKKGNAFPNLYDPYKNYRPYELKVSNQREKALLEIQMLDFSINDLNLYLDMHPEDVYAYNIFKNYVEECKRKKDAYSKTYGPLVVDDITDEWEWSKGVWPWEEGAM